MAVNLYWTHDCTLKLTDPVFDCNDIAATYTIHNALKRGSNVLQIINTCETGGWDPPYGPKLVPCVYDITTMLNINYALY